MNALPSWLDETVWQKFSAAEQENALRATKALYGIGSMTDIAMAEGRGIPYDPIWLNGVVDEISHADLLTLEASVKARLTQEMAEQYLREQATRDRQRVCQHTFEDVPGASHHYCPKCSLMEACLG